MLEDCVIPPNQPHSTKITKDSFGAAHDGTDITRYTIKNKTGMILQVINYGATITAITLPMRCGPHDVVLGFDDMSGYLSEKNAYFGATIGRVTNRTRPSKVKVNGECVSLSANLGRDIHLHGGNKGFDKVIWNAETRHGMVIMTYVSRHLEEGYPGQLTVTATFQVTQENAIYINYRATTDRPTLVNITNHTYFNLAGHGAGSEGLLKHKVSIDSFSYTQLCDLIATGPIEPVMNTGYDLQKPKNLREALGHLDKCVDGFDINYCLKPPFSCLKLAATAFYKPKCVAMEVYTNSAGLQFYTANKLRDVCGKDGAVYCKHSGFCFECQGYPNAANIAKFPTIVLKPGEEYKNDILWKFKFRGVDGTCTK